MCIDFTYSFFAFSINSLPLQSKTNIHLGFHFACSINGMSSLVHFCKTSPQKKHSTMSAVPEYLNLASDNEYLFWHKVGGYELYDFNLDKNVV